MKKKCNDLFKPLIKEKRIHKIQPVFQLLYSQEEWDEVVSQNKSGNKRR